jgi:RHS repeat-associated protein
LPESAAQKERKTHFTRIQSAIIRQVRWKWETAKYNERLQVTQIGLGSSATDTSLLKINYSYGTNLENNGSLREQKINYIGLANEIKQSYGYDNLNRLQSSVETVNNAVTWQQTFSYDRFGNRRFDAANTNTLSNSVAAKVANPQINTSDNRLKKDQDNDTIADYDYDKTGNMTLDAENKRFIYDAENHVKSFFKGTNSSATPDATYFYDGEGRRVKKISSTETTIFVYDGGSQLVAEYSTKTSDQPKVSFLTADHLGSPRIITDGNGKVISRHDYLAFGDEVTDTVGNVGGRNSTQGYGVEDDIRKQYTGYEKDEESGLDFAKARYYNGKHGRFTSVDPMTASANVKDPQTFNRYSYAMNSPYKFTDPLGLVATGVGQGSSSGGDVGHSHLSNNKGLNAEFSDREPKWNVVVSATVNSPGAQTERRPQWLLDIMKRIADRPVTTIDIPTRSIFILLPKVESFDIDFKYITAESVRYNAFDASKVSYRGLGATLNLSLLYLNTNNVLKGYKYTIDGDDTKTTNSGIIKLGKVEPVFKLYNEGDTDPGFIQGDVNQPVTQEFTRSVIADIGGYKNTINISGAVTVRGSEVNVDYTIKSIPAKAQLFYVYTLPKNK